MATDNPHSWDFGPPKNSETQRWDFERWNSLKNLALSIHVARIGAGNEQSPAASVEEAAALVDHCTTLIPRHRKEER